MLGPSWIANLHNLDVFKSCHDRFKGSVFGTAGNLEVELSPIDIRRMIVTTHQTMWRAHRSNNSNAAIPTASMLLLHHFMTQLCHGNLLHNIKRHIDADKTVLPVLTAIRLHYYRLRVMELLKSTRDLSSFTGTEVLCYLEWEPWTLTHGLMWEQIT